MTDNLVLVGYMGAGKSTIGRSYANKYNMKYIDTDDYIENHEHSSISDIFQAKGEKYFRQLETTVISELISNEQNAVISTGGGMPMREENQILLGKLGTVIFLKASMESIWDRVRNDTKRPLLQCDNPKGRIIDMLRVRNPIYTKCADICVETDNKSIEEIISIIERSLL